MIDKLEAARRQLDRAIIILDEDDLSAHTLAYAAFCLLRDKFGPGEMMDMIKDVEGSLRLDEIPGFLKHGDRHPDAILKEHSPETVYATITFAIRLWREHGREETEPMRAFSLRPNPYEAGKRHALITEIIESGEIADAGKVTALSTGGHAIERGPRRR